MASKALSVKGFKPRPADSLIGIPQMTTANQLHPHYTSATDFAARLDYSIRGFYNLKKRGLIPDPDGKFPHSKALFWLPETVESVASSLVKGAAQ